MSAPQPPGGARTVRVPAERLERWLGGFADRHGATEVTSGPETVRLHAADGSRAWIAVPFPPLDGELVGHVLRARRIGVLLVRRGGYAAGVFDGADLIASKVGSTYVQGRTAAGGSSQQRFARRRANQASYAFAAAADVAHRVLVQDGGRLDALITGGDRAAVRAVLDDRRLADLAQLRSEPWLAVPDPRLRVLQATPEQFRAVAIRLDP